MASCDEGRHSADRLDAFMRRRIELLVESTYGTVRILHAAGLGVPADKLGEHVARELDSIVTTWSNLRAACPDADE